MYWTILWLEEKKIKQKKAIERERRGMMKNLEIIVTMPPLKWTTSAKNVYVWMRVPCLL